MRAIAAPLSKAQDDGRAARCHRAMPKDGRRKAAPTAVNGATEGEPRRGRPVRLGLDGSARRRRDERGDELSPVADVTSSRRTGRGCSGLSAAIFLFVERIGGGLKTRMLPFVSGREGGNGEGTTARRGSIGNGAPAICTASRISRGACAVPGRTHNGGA
jgi:hypothetical protein